MSKRQRVVATDMWEQLEIRFTEEDVVRGSVAG